MHDLIIDVATSDCKKLINKLKKLKSTLSICNGGQYRECMGYSQIHITTTKTENDMDDWLYKVKHNCDYVGVVER